MQILAQDDTTKARVYCYEKDGSDPRFEVTVGGFVYSHSLRHVENPDTYQWYCEVMGRQFFELHERSLKQGRQQIQFLLRQALEG